MTSKDTTKFKELDFEGDDFLREVQTDKELEIDKKLIKLKRKDILELNNFERIRVYCYNVFLKVMDSKSYYDKFTLGLFTNVSITNCFRFI